jgi:hypothetical protein
VQKYRIIIIPAIDKNKKYDIFKKKVRNTCIQRVDYLLEIHIKAKKIQFCAKSYFSFFFSKRNGLLCAQFLNRNHTLK